MLSERSLEPDAPVSLRRRFWLRAALASAGGVGMAGWGGAASASTLAVGKPAPPLVLQTLDGRHIATRDLLGKVVIATFWATWCSPCLAELPLLSQYFAKYRKQGLEVLAFSLDGTEQLEDVRKFAARLEFPVGLLGSPWAGEYGRIWRIPVSFTMARDGTLVDNGWDDKEPVWTSERLDRIVTPLFKLPG
jgi:cytochrome c biogenesis protein CcmG, thiol:disulfide interchange protein DsbE